MQVIEYGKAHAVIGDTKPHSSDLKDLGLKFNPALTINGVKTPGWIVFNNKLEDVTKYMNNNPKFVKTVVNVVSTGKVEPKYSLKVVKDLNVISVNQYVSSKGFEPEADYVTTRAKVLYNMTKHKADMNPSLRHVLRLKEFRTVSRMSDAELGSKLGEYDLPLVNDRFTAELLVTLFGHSEKLSGQHNAYLSELVIEMEPHLEKYLPESQEEDSLSSSSGEEEFRKLKK